MTPFTIESTQTGQLRTFIGTKIAETEWSEHELGYPVLIQVQLFVTTSEHLICWHHTFHWDANVEFSDYVEAIDWPTLQGRLNDDHLYEILRSNVAKARPTRSPVLID